MCGVGGVLGLHDDAALRGRCSSVMAALRHRGPDDSGQFISAEQGIGFVHTRLAILDLSPSGHQPMATSEGRYTIVFNGEIYNFAQIRRELISQGVSFRGAGDTEVILKLYERDGAECVRQFEGMFAFAIWDKQTKTAFLARGPLGIKPLYIWQHRGQLAFASELRAVLKADLGPKKLSMKGLCGYLLFGSVQEPDTLVEGVSMLPPGHHLTWREGKAEIKSYWDVRFKTETTTPEDAITSTRAALNDSIKRHFVSDVPVGLFLSGGVDSTALAVLAKANGFDNLQTFSVGFDEADYDESDLATKTARHIGAKHHQWRISAEEGRGLLSTFLDSIDQPSNDGFNTFCVSKLARDQGFKVVLSGLGGDELFGGYPSFAKVPDLMRWRNRGNLAGFMRSTVAASIQNLSFSGRINRMAALLESPNRSSSAYWAMRGIFTPREVIKIAHTMTGNRVEAGDCDFGNEPPAHIEQLDIVSYLEMNRYMVNQLLRDSDVMSMAHGLELRVPLVDWRLIDSVGKIPSAIRLSLGKQLLLDAVPEIPTWIRETKKRGFSFPFEEWTKGGNWNCAFKSIDAWSPVRTATWYRRWTLLTLEHFLAANKIDGIATLSA